MTVKNPSDFWSSADRTPAVSVMPCLSYEDVAAAIELLVDGFGFERQLVVKGEDGLIDSAQLVHKTGDGGSQVSGLLPLKRAEDGTKPAPASVYVLVSEVDSHCERARGAGVEIMSGPADRDDGSRDYTAQDVQGHVWTFGTHDPLAAKSGLSYEEDDRAGIIELRVAGRVNAADFEAVTARMEAFFARHDKVRLIEVIERFDGMDWSLLFDDMLFSMRHLSRFSHVAVVTDLRWAERMANAAAIVLSARLRVFPLNELEAAKQWAHTSD